MPEIVIKDEIARRKLELMRVAVREEQFGKPWLDLDTNAYAEYREGRRADPPDQDHDPPNALMLRDVQGEDALLLAGGGGQQSAQYALCGANVTVFDLTPEQLELDQLAADHYGYQVNTIQGDMRDLSRLPSDHFARVLQPVSSLFVPDLDEVYQGVARVLKTGGLYYCDYTYPVLYMAENKGWDGEAYVLRFSQPHVRGRILEREVDGLMNFTEGEFFAEFNHRLSDIINGLIAHGLQVVGVWESPRPGRPEPSDLTPGSYEHQLTILPRGLAVVSKLIGDV